MVMRKLVTGFLIAFVVLSIALALQKHLQTSNSGPNNPEEGINGSDLIVSDGSTDGIDTPDISQQGINTEPDNSEEGNVPQVLAADNLQQNRLIVYYFHRSMRCTGCINVEEGAYQAVSIDHEEDIADGSLEWQSINFEEPEYGHFMAEYDLYSQELILIEMRDGIEIRYGAIAEVWQHWDDKTKIRQIVNGLIEEWLRGIQES